jgi:diguanylate cyclase (GGDEF)-like protein
LAVLAVIAIAFGATPGRGMARRRRPLDRRLLAHDALTGLPSRQGLSAILADAVAEARATDRQVGLIVVSLEDFRAVNDVWGHAAGDEVLKAAAARLRTLADGPTGLARIDGDEFAMVVAQNTATLRDVAEKVCTVLGAPYAVDGSSIVLAPKLGAALFPVNADSPDMLLRAAGTALSQAKDSPGAKLAIFDTEMAGRMQQRTALQRDLRTALEREEFVVFYQPQLDLASGRVRGYEALVRWERPGEGILAPRDFLSVAEETGLIRPIGHWVLRRACRDAASWLDAGTVAVNLTAAQFRFQDVDKTIAAVLDETKLPAERLEIEVPEGVFLNAGQDVMDALTRIKALGVRIAMDDFGSGYTALSTLARFPFDKVKIDKAFVDQLTEDADVAAIVASIVALGRSLSLDITAEGVETHEQVTLLKAAGCSIAQGFLFGTPQRTAAPPEGEARERKSVGAR